MKPILFNQNETHFTDNGRGRLVDCISCVVTEERNGIFECEFQYPVTGRMFSEIKEGRIIGIIHDDSKDIQPFDIYAHSTPLNGIVTFYAHHISYRLGNVILKPMTASSCVEAFTNFPNKTYNPCPFSFWTDKAVAANWENDIPSPIKAILGGSEGSILDIYGKGEYEWDKWTVKLHTNRGHDNGVSIRYGVNLTDLLHDYDISGSYNAVVPYWKSKEEGTLVTLSDGYIAVDEYLQPWTTHTGAIMEDGEGNVIYFKTNAASIAPIPMDLSDAFENQPTEAQLQAEAVRRLQNSEAWLPSENITVQFVNLADTEEYKNISALQRVRLCDKVSVYCGPLGVSAIKMQVIKVVYDVLAERYDEIELGKPKTRFADTLNASMKSYVEEKTAEMVTSSMMQEAIDNATDHITGAQDSHVTFVYDANGGLQEILIMDTDSVTTAMKVWRWNSGGLGYSSNGYAGPYSLAMTQDGAIVADMITTGVLSANLIKAGILSDGAGKNFWNLLTGEFSLSGGAAFGNSTVSAVINAMNSAISDVDVEYAQNQSTTTAPTSGWSTTAPAWRDGYYIWQRTKTTTASGTSYSQPTCISGRDGVGITSVTEYYALNNSTTAPGDSSFSTGVKTPTAANKYVWNYELITYTDNTTSKTEKHIAATYGDTGATGNGISGIVEYYAVNNSTTAPADSAFSTTISAPTAANKYLWNYEQITYTDGSTVKTGKRVIGTYGEKGATGIGVSAVVEQYYLSTSSSTQSGGSWSTDQPQWVSGKYIWTRSQVTWTDNTTTYTTPVLAQAINGANSAASSAQSAASSAQSAASSAQSAVTTLDNSLNQQGVFNRLTNNGQTQGIYLNNGLLYINASYIKSGIIDGTVVQAKLLNIVNEDGDIISSFADTIVLGNNNYFKFRVLPNSISFIKSDGTPTFQYGDLRDESGVATLEYTFVGNGSNTRFEVQHRISSILIVKVNNTVLPEDEYSFGAPSDYYINLKNAPADGANIYVKFTSNYECMYFTVGLRKANSVIGNNSVSIGNYNIASGHNSYAIGTIVDASGESSHAEGYNTKAIGDYSHVEGRNNTASGNYSHAEGGTYLTNQGTTASGNSSHAEGNYTTASGNSSHAEGGSTTASGTCSHAEGNVTIASGTCSHAEGNVTIASGYSSHVEGGNNTASGNYSHAEGYYTTASGDYSHAEGNGTTADYDNQHVSGKYNISGDNAEIVGNGVSWNRSNARTLDWSGNEWIAGTLTQASDSRLKEESGEVPDLSDIRARRFKWNDKKGAHDDLDHIGYFAQDVENVAPYLVVEDAMGYKSLDYNGVMVAKIASLEKRVAELERIIIEMKRGE